MAELEEECTFEVAPDKLTFTTAQNGDRVIAKGLNFTPGQAASIAWLINKEEILEIQIKMKE